jgi:transposase-like protein
MFTQKQIDELLKNKNVNKCGFKSITYNKEFKTKAIRSYFEEGLSPNMIFKKAGFDLNVIGKEKPKNCLKRWRKIHKEKGEEGLLKENRGGPGRKRKLVFESKDEEIKYLKTKVKYLDTENDFLAELRGLKRE